MVKKILIDSQCMGNNIGSGIAYVKSDNSIHFHSIVGTFGMSLVLVSAFFLLFNTYRNTNVLKDMDNIVESNGGHLDILKGNNSINTWSFILQFGL